MSERNGLEIAVIGMAGRFAKASNLQQFWRNLRDGVEGIHFFTDEELAGIIPAAMLARSNYVKACGVLEDADLFDAAFFDYSPRDAQILDPQQRLLLECGWEALESAGYAGTDRPVGVFVGVTQNAYMLQLAGDPEIASSIGLFGLSLSNEKDHAAPRMAYKLNLEGPSVTVQTACSTGLIAVHLACQSLLAGECELALAGAASVRVPMKQGHLYQEGGIASDDGHTRTFDARARGTATGQGIGLVLLKLLEDALADGDPIHAVIKGSAINNDGAQKPGFTAPRREGQMKVIRAALLRAEVSPESIGFIEAHGTATPLGDPIEVSALTRSFRMSTQKRGFCALGSVKSNLGHLDVAAGVAGLIKAVLAIEHGEVPPSLHFESPNPEIDFAASPFYVNTQLNPWPSLEGPRRAGVSAFGVGGANAHVILEEAPQPLRSGPARPFQLLTLSARTATALERMSDNLAAHLRDNAGEELADVAYTLRVGRRDLRHRRAVVAASSEEAAAALTERDPRRVMSLIQEGGNRPVAFLLPGVGDQYPGMATGLYRSEAVFREQIDRCAELLLPSLGLDLRDVLFAGAAAAPAAGQATSGGLDLRAVLRRGEAPSANDGPLSRTRVAQPAVFALGYALAQLWMSWGIRPQALLGYSLGEYTAACLAGVLSLEDALSLVADRARLIDDLPAGAMLALPLKEDEVSRLLPPELSLAAVNAPEVCVVAGEIAAIAALEDRLNQQGLLCRRIPTSHAFHSRMMAPISAAFRERVRKITLHPPRIPYLSNVTGTWARENEVVDGEYWVRHLCGTVRFAAAIGELWTEPGRVLLEVGPGQTLGSLALQHPASAHAAHATAVPSLRHQHDRQDDQAFLLRALGQLWLAGVDMPANALTKEERRRRVRLPTYPFERQRYWVNDKRAPVPARQEGAPSPEGKIADPADWFHIPSWKLAARAPVELQRKQRWLVLADAFGLADRLTVGLEAMGREVVVTQAGPAFARLGERRYALPPGDAGSYDDLLADLGAMPERVIHAWSLRDGDSQATLAAIDGALENGFFSLMALAQALGRRISEQQSEIAVVTNGLCAVERADPLLPENATLVGPIRVISQEYPFLTCRAIDVDLREAAGAGSGELLSELDCSSTEPIVALRGRRRWIPTTEPVPLPPTSQRPAPLRVGGVYLITGGLGGLGLAVAGHLARQIGAKLALVSRTPLPERSEWQRITAAEGDGESALARRVRGVQALETAGAEVIVLAADVADEVRMRQVVAEVRQRFGSLNGVFHTAGVPGSGLLQLKSRDAAAAVLAPKVRGTLALAAALRDVPVDFVVLYSAVASLTGGIGQVDYCAANAFLDAFACQRRERAGEPVVAVNWCEWQWDDWSARLTAMDPRIQQEVQRQRRLYGLTPEEGMEALARILASELPQVVVSTRNLRMVIEQQHSISQLLHTLDEAAQAGAGRHARPSLPTAYVAPRDDREARLADTWRILLGVDRVGVHDNFFQLGGHSLLGLQVMSRIHEAFQIELPLRVLFEAPTVAELAALVAAAQEEGVRAPNAAPELRPAASVRSEEVLQNLDTLSEEEMDALIAQMAEEEDLFGDAGP